jgi:WD40 repeat protein
VIRRFLPFGLVVAALVPFVQAQTETAASRPESAASRPSKRVSARRLSFPVKGYASVPSGCSFSPDGKLLAVATGYDQRDLSIFAFPTGDVVFSDSSANPRDPAFSPKSDKLVYVYEHGIGIVERDGAVWRAAEPIALPFKPGIFFPDPRVLPWSRDGAAVVVTEWDAGVYEINARSRILRKLDAGTDPVLSSVVVDAGLAVSTFAEGAFRTTIFRSGIAVEWLSEVRILAVSPDQSSWLVARLGSSSGAKTPREKAPAVEIWDANPRRLRARVDFKTSDDGFQGLCHGAFSADGSRLLTGDFKVVDVRDGRTGEILCTIDHYRGDRVVAACISPDGRHVLTMGRPTARTDDGVILWELVPE